MEKNSKLKIRNVNINPTRVGILQILNMMGFKIKKKKFKEI